MPKKYITVDDYFADASAISLPILQKIRSIIQRVAPEAKETISYNIPAFKTDRVFVYFAAYKKHIGIYPPVGNDTKLLNKLEPYLGDKGNLRIPISDPFPFDLVEEVTTALLLQYDRGN